MIIIKSGSRTTASFSQLLHYMNKGRIEGDEYFFKHNVYSFRTYGIVREFMQNHKLLKRRKNGVALYHEYISIKYQKGYTKEQLREILIDLTEQYTQARANNCLVYSVIHEQHNQIHCHMMISGNEVESKKAHYFSQAEFEEIKDRTRQYAYEKYPELERDENEKTRARTKEQGKERTKDKTKRKAKSVDREVHLKKRTGKQSEREKTRERLHTIFKLSSSPKDFIKKLRLEGLEIYQRGQTYGFMDTATGKKYRLKTLELEGAFLDMTSRFNDQKEKNTAQENDKKQKHEQKQKGTKQEQKQKNMKQEQEKSDPDFEKQEPFGGRFHKQAFGESKSGKEYIRESIKVTLEASKTFEEFLSRLDEQHIKIYRINDTFGFVDIQTGWKYRLHTLGLENEFENFVIKVKQPRSFKDKVKDFGKRLFHEAVNDIEHLITGKKPSLEDEIWTQEKAGNREVDKKKNQKKVYDHASELNNDELSKQAFKQKMKEARKTREKTEEKNKEKEFNFTKK